ncbi:protein of unknown function [Burkholderia multivorans]
MPSVLAPVPVEADIERLSLMNANDNACVASGFGTIWLEWGRFQPYHSMRFPMAPRRA